MTNNQEGLRLMLTLLEYLSQKSEKDAQKGEGLIELEVEKDADSQVYEWCKEQIKRWGGTPTPERTQAYFDYLAQQKGTK